MGSLGKFKPYFAAIFLQVGLAGMNVLSKAALNQRMSNYALVVYHHTIATLVMIPFAAIIEKYINISIVIVFDVMFVISVMKLTWKFYLDREMRPKMTMSIFIKIMVLGLLEPGQNSYYVGMKYTTATFAAAMYTILPAITFLMAWIFRFEKVNFRSISNHAMVIDTLATVAGAMVMTLMKGLILELLWTKLSINNHEAASKKGTDFHHTVKGGLMNTVGCFCYACLVVLQAFTLKTYLAELSLTAWVCLMAHSKEP
ncbi:WAT1-related protein [Hibiscus syriacus]|uniref:WAT1-related protein n=1 Tax=Hibiscus syriacus TaxID=106335 RepID=A0A6A3D9P0_HIBSY|nr:WAT1-related protein [Hibiscus syriacus]